MIHTHNAIAYAAAATFTITSQVIPQEVRRQGLNQENPCTEDMVEFTCTRSESLGDMRWSANGETLYTFLIPDDINTTNARRSSILGVTGVIINETVLTLLVDLSISTKIVNGSEVECGGRNSASQSASVILVTIGIYYKNKIA